MGNTQTEYFIMEYEPNPHTVNPVCMDESISIKFGVKLFSSANNNAGDDDTEDSSMCLN